MVPREFPTRGFAAIWGAGRTNTRGPTPSFSVREVVQEGVAIADIHGAEAVTLPAVASALGMATNSLYRYIAGKEELLLLVRDAGFGAPPKRIVQEDWRTSARLWLEELLACYTRRPWLMEIQTSEPPALPNTVAWLEALLSGLDGSPWDGQDALQLATMLDRLAQTLGSLQVGVMESKERQARRRPLVEFLKEQTAASGFTRVGALIDAGEYMQQTPVFEIGLALDWVFASLSNPR